MNVEAKYEDVPDQAESASLRWNPPGPALLIRYSHVECILVGNSS